MIERMHGNAAALMLHREAPRINIGCYCLEYNVNHAKSLLLVQDYPILPYLRQDCLPAPSACIVLGRITLSAPPFGHVVHHNCFVTQCLVNFQSTVLQILPVIPILPRHFPVVLGAIAIVQFSLIPFHILEANCNVLTSLRSA